MKNINYELHSDGKTNRYERIRRRQWLKQRRKLVKYWPFAGVGALVIWIGMYAYFFLKIPYLVNPQALSHKIETAGDHAASLALNMSVFTPLLMIVLFIVVTAVLALGFVIISKEKKYLEIIDDLERLIEDESDK